MKLYHYTSLDKFVKLICNAPSPNSKNNIEAKIKLRFGSFAKTNDLFETKDYFSFPKDFGMFWICFSKEIREKYREERLKYQPLCFSMDKSDGKKGYQISAMWAHYGDNHKGVCLEIETDKLDIHSNENLISKDVNYASELLITELPSPSEKMKINADYLNYITEHIEKNIEKILFTKDNSWKYEQEHRVLHKVDNKEEVNYLDITNALERIILGPQIDILGQDYNILRLLIKDSHTKIEVEQLSTTYNNGKLSNITDNATNLWDRSMNEIFYNGKKITLNDIFEWHTNKKEYK